MLFGGDDEDLDFTSSTGRTKLASLFDMDRAASQGGNESLTYTAPKEPKKRPDTASQPSGTSSSVFSAGVAYAYKFVDDKYVSEGKLGVAVIGSHTNSDYKLLLYLSKEKPVAFAKITPSFVFSVQPNNYANFYDDTRRSWSLMFETESTLQQFAQQVALLKFCSNTPKKDDLLVSQDLALGDGTTPETGDSVTIKYSAWHLENNAIGSVIETGQESRFRIGKQRTIKAWDEGVVGMKKSGKRLLISSPALCTGGDIKPGKFPTGVPIVFEVEIIKLRQSRDKNEDSAAPASVPTTVSASVPSSVPQVVADDDREDSVKSKSKTISDQMSQQPAKPDKARLISRMAKMGQPMLPVVPPQPTDATEAEATSPSPIKPEVPLKPGVHGAGFQHGTSAYPAAGIVPETVFIPQSVSPMGPMMVPPSVHTLPQSSATMLPGASGQLSIYHSSVPMPFQAMMGGFPQQPGNQPFGSMYQSQMYPGAIPQQPPPPPVSQPMTDTSVPMMLMETRNQNTEVRVSLSRVSDKIDRISEKLDQLQNRQSNAMTVASSMPTMEVGMLLHNIERIVMDNERLKKENIEKSSRVEEQNIKINELLQRNQIYVEQSNAFLEQRNDSYKTTASQSQAKIQALEQEKVNLAMDLSSTTSQLASFQLEIASLKKREGELKQQLDRLLSTDIQSREDASSMRLRLVEQDQRLEQLEAQLKQDNHDKKTLVKQLETLKDNLNDVTAERNNLDKNLNDRKKKSAEEISKLEGEMKEMQTNYEAELETLKGRLKLERNSTESTAAQKLTEIEEDLNREWKEKSDRLLTSAQEKHQRELAEAVNEKTWLQEKVENLEAKVAEFKSLRSTLEQEKETLQEELDQSRTWKDRYDNVRTQASAMKERYEQRLRELEEERSAADEEREKAEQERDKAHDRVRRLQVQLSSTQAQGGSSSAENTHDIVASEVKKIMNTVYRRLRKEFEPAVEYLGSDINTVILDNIKVVTLEMMRDKEAAAPAGVQSAVKQEKTAVKDPDNFLQSSSSASDSTETSVDEEARARHEVRHVAQSNLEGNNSESIDKREVAPPVEHDSNISPELNVDKTPVSAVLKLEANDGESNKEVEHNKIAEGDEARTDLVSDVEENTNDTSSEVLDSSKNPENSDVVVESESQAVEKLESVPETTEITSDVAEKANGSEEHVENVQVTNDSTSNESHENSTEKSVSPDEVKLEDNSIGALEVEEKGLKDTVEAISDSNVPSTETENSEALVSTSNTSATDPLQSGDSHSAPTVVSKAQKESSLFGDEDDDDFKVANDTPKQSRKNLPPKNSSLFGDLDEDDGLFSVGAEKPSVENKLPTSGSRPSSGTKRMESDDDLAKKPPPLPLFGDSDDEKDLDWLS